MPGSLDPYHRWFGIPAAEQPADHYRLLGLERFEEDLDAIENAVSQRTAYLGRVQTGEHSELSQKLLAEVAAARVCLLNEAKKAAYDRQLRENSAARVPPPRRRPKVGGAARPDEPDDFAPLAPFPHTRSAGITAAARRRSGARSRQQVIAGIAIAVSAAGALGVIVLLLSRSPSADRATIEPLRKPEVRETTINTQPAPQEDTPPEEPPAATPDTLAQGLVGHWRLDRTDAAQPGVAVDSTGHHHGTILGNPTWIAGRIGDALDFNGVEDYISLGNPSTLQITGAITLSAWVMPKDFGEFNVIVEHGFCFDPKAEVYLRINNGNYAVGMWDGTDRRAEYPATAEDLGKWFHVAGTYDGDAWRLYRNGRLVASFASDAGAVAVEAEWAIGARANAENRGTAIGRGGRYFRGAIDDVRIYDRALSPDEIQALATQPQ